MMKQAELAATFAGLHIKGDPLVLFNVWDAGSADAVALGGAKAIATGSWGVAMSQGFSDGESLAMQDVLRVAKQIVDNVALPVSVDFEGGYDEGPKLVAANVAALLETGVVGLNFEDRIVKGSGLHDVDLQVARIAAIRATADAKGVPLFINARTDVFFQGSNAAPEELLDRVIMRAVAYAGAGANGLFVPGLVDLELISKLCVKQDLPVNIMRMGDAPSIVDLAAAGVARISHGPGPYMAAMKALTEAAQSVA